MVRQVITFDGYLKEVEDKMNKWMKENEDKVEVMDTDLVAVNSNLFAGMITYVEIARPKRPRLETK
jgi:hypothetical protein